MTTVQSQLSRHVPKPATSEAEIRIMAARAFHERGVVTIFAGDLRNEMEQRWALSIGERLYGKQGARYQQEAK